MTNGAPAAAPRALRRLDTPAAVALAELSAAFEELQTVLRCCERLVSELGATGSDPDELVVDALWTMALLSYARCFPAGGAGAALSEGDVTAAQPAGDVLDWHRVLLRLRGHYADPAINPRERFSVGVAQDPNGAADGIAITSARQPLVDELTVRQTGAIAFALSRLVDERIAAQQRQLLGDVKSVPRAELDKLDQLEVAEPA